MGGAPSRKVKGSGDITPEKFVIFQIPSGAF